ncbi:MULTISPECIES: ParM/StbA family protein [Bacillaceae]|jgi:plasmid segregation protein ParM|uniref:ParM/StbA family protein n=1 Tax=Bacillaceae TaxID=186817 RepID=UPI0010F7BB4B|nr:MULTISPECIES: ParM/StbA family protein [Bacillaceae]MCI1592655.1 ParM/StbA family protein [Heyndrickxia oleronia]MCI1614422.1 ParM/StbA family protein [Heyndrickxia oleronia]MCI1745467.1 ParM/StbA family protein [Heyndrickxia oleronia]MCI1763790.1 ParM/StbA family protein [Heyndrickxia oleronia]
MREPVLIAVDCGKYATKAILKSKDKHAITVFRTKMQEVEKVGIEVNPGSYEVTYNKKSYLVGDTVNESFSNFDLTKKIDLHKICIYTAIADLLQLTNLQTENIKIQLAINIPISAYKDATSKKEYINFIENHGEPILFDFNGKTYYLHLKDVVVAFEGVGIIYDEMEQMKGKYTAVVDIGGLNTTYCMFNGINPIFDSMTVSNLGINIMKGKIGKLINERFGVAVTPNDLERILQTGYLSHAGMINENSKKLIQQIKEQHFREIVEFAKSRDYTFNNISLDFVGGGAYMLCDIIQKEFPHARIVINPQFANVKSFLRILEIKNGL